MSPAIDDLRAERVNRGLSIAGAAREMGILPDALARAERGKSRPHPRNALAIASFYGFKVTDIWPLEPAETEPAEPAVA